MEINDISELYKITKEKLEGQHGTITINFANRSHVYFGNDVIGNCLQEWLPDWFKYLGVNIFHTEQTQAFPDFVIALNEASYDIEVKAWNCNNNPAFDLANFHSFLETTFESPRKIDAYYFILGYKPMDDGFYEGFKVEKIYLKKIWEITSPSKKYPIGIQVKRGQPYAIRPTSFHKNTDKRFKSKEEFLYAIKKTYDLFPCKGLKFSAEEWINKILSC